MGLLEKCSEAGTSIIKVSIKQVIKIKKAYCGSRSEN
jgi:hypothetical protein